jgi:pimeloyl-ACP methyl ester carboxylesterase
MQPFDDWRARGRFHQVQRRRVFAVDAGAGDVVAILHGFPSWSGDFALVLDALTREHRVVVHDHVGFGLSEKPDDYGYSLFEQADIAIGLWKSLGIERIHLLAHDYGTSVTTEILARRERGLLPVEVASVTFTNGSLLLELARLRVGQKLLQSRWGPLYARLANRALFLRSLRAVLRKPVDDGHLEAMWRALEHDGGRLLLPRISRYLEERVRFRDRFVGALQRLDIAAHVLWADADPVSVSAIGDALAAMIPGAAHTVLPGVGHYPMLEDPVAFSDATTNFLGDKRRTSP